MSDEAYKAMETYPTAAEIDALMPFLKTAEHASPESRTKLCGKAVLCITTLLEEIAAKDAEIARLREAVMCGLYFANGEANRSQFETLARAAISSVKGGVA